MKKLAIVTTHPIQYNAPFFRLLNERGKVYPKVFYTWPQAINGFDDPLFGREVKWDIPLLDGYAWEAVENISKNPSSKTWGGIDCPGLIRQIKDFAPDAILVYPRIDLCNNQLERYLWYAHCLKEAVNASTKTEEILGFKTDEMFRVALGHSGAKPEDADEPFRVKCPICKGIRVKIDEL